MPTKPTKGDHGNADHGSQEGGAQKATYGSSRLGVQEPPSRGADAAREQPAGDEDRNP